MVRIHYGQLRCFRELGSSSHIEREVLVETGDYDLEGLFIRLGSAIEAIVSLSRVLNMKAIAEAVETREQWDFLAGLGCQEFQGYLFAHPIPVKEFEKLMSGPFCEQGSRLPEVY